jgi:hypothetical protein
MRAVNNNLDSQQEHEDMLGEGRHQRASEQWVQSRAESVENTYQRLVGYISAVCEF